MAVHDGFVHIDRISFDAYSESHDVEMQAEAYRQRTGTYPEGILGDKAYQNRVNRQWCNERGIRLMGQKLGRPFEEPMIQRLFKRMERIEEIERVEVEGRFGIMKRRYGLNLIKGKSPETAKTMIMLIALVANIAQKTRDILFVLIQLISKALVSIEKRKSLGLNKADWALKMI